jgi:polyisoprenoid-binding protein YceI
MSWSIDTAHSEINFAIQHMMITKVRGQFEKFTGEINFNAQNPENSTVEIEIEIDSINTREAKRDAHLRSADFFDADNFPKMTFKSTKVEKTGENTARLTGDLTIRDITHPVTLEVEHTGVAVNPYGKTVAGFSARGKINRKEWELNWNVALETGGWLVGEEVEINIELQLVKETETEAVSA